MAEPKEKLEKGENADLRHPANQNSKKNEREKKPKKSLRAEVVNFSLIVISVLAGLSITSYSPADDAIVENISFFGMFKFFIGDESMRAMADTVRNWLGIFGAYISYFFVVKTLGYFSIVFPLILLVFSWTALLKKDYKNAARISTMVLIYAITISTLSGYLKTLFGTDEYGTEWFGGIGMFSARALIGVFNAVGAAAVIFLVLFALVVFTLKISPQELISAFGAVFSWVFNSTKRFFSWIFAAKKTVSVGEGVQIAKQALDPLSGKEKSGFFKKEPVKIVREDAKPKVDPGLIEDAKELVKRTFTRARTEEEVPDDEAEDDRQGSLFTKRAFVPTPRSSNPTESINQDEEIEYIPPPLELLDVPIQVDKISDDELRANAELLRSKLKVFDIEIENVSVIPGPVVTLYELVPASGVKISRITSLADDLALALQARGIRIIAPIPGKGAVGVEIPNHKPQIVNFRSVVSSAKFQDLRFNLPIAMGKTITGEIFVDDLSRMPHLLIAGATGSGKSVGINTIMMSMIYKLHPREIKFVIIDPKKIELSLYKKLKRHFLAVSPDIDEEIITDSSNAVSILKSVEREMDDRYSLSCESGRKKYSGL